MTASELATAAVVELPVAVMGIGIVISNHRLHTKLIDKLGDRVRVVNPPKAPAGQPQAEAAQVPVDQADTSPLPKVVSAA